MLNIVRSIFNTSRSKQIKVNAVELCESKKRRTSRVSTMHSLPLFTILFLMLSRECECNIRKCCPKDEVLLRITRFERVTYDCLSLDDQILEEGRHHPLKVVKHGVRLSGFPEKCESYEEVDVSKPIISDGYCIDKLIAEHKDNYTSALVQIGVVLLRCRNHDGNKEIYIPHPVSDVLRKRIVPKCCSRGSVIDLETNSCVNISSGHGTNRYDEFVESEVQFLDIRSDFDCISPSVVYQFSDQDYIFRYDEDDGNVLNLVNGSTRYRFQSDSYCLEASLQGPIIARVCRDKCDMGPCINRCCEEGAMYRFKNCSKPPSCLRSKFPHFGVSEIDFYDVSNMKNPIMVDPPQNVGFRYGVTCAKYRLDPDDEEDLNFFDVITGNLMVPFLAPSAMQEAYCVEMVEARCSDEAPTLFKFVCFPPAEEEVHKNEKFRMFGIGILISCFFLTLTFLVYIILPQLRNLHGKTLMCHVISMLIAYCCLARVQLTVVKPQILCKILGYIIYFAFLSAFSWLNIMCIDIWWTFGNVRTVHGMNRNKDLKKFLQYCLYGWGFPILLTITIFLFDYYTVAPGWLYPRIGESQCWFPTSSQKTPWLILFIMPIGIQIVINVILFILTAIHCSRVKSEIHRMQIGSMGEKCKRRFLADKAKYVMNFKLFVVMGITWTLEIVSSVVTEPKIVYDIADVINVLQGIPIFFILVFKKKVYHLMRKRLGLEKDKERIRSDMTTTTGVSSSIIDPNARKSLPTSALIPMKSQNSFTNSAKNI